MVFNEGEEIIRLNEYAPYIYYLEKGSAKSRYRISSDNTMLDFDIQEGMLFGELTLFSESMRSCCSIRASSPTTTLKRLHMPLVFQYFLFDPMLALRWYCLIGKNFCSVLRALDMYSVGNIEEFNISGVYASITVGGETGDLSSLLFKEKFPDLEGQHVIRECPNAWLLGSLSRGRAIMLYVTGEYFCYFTRAVESKREPVSN